jgi:hypothetical protein
MVKVSTTIRKMAAFLVFGWACSGAASACSCAGPIPVCSVYWTTSDLFVGHVVKIEHVYDEPPGEKVVDGKKISWIGPGQYLVHFAITKYYRGTPVEQVVVRTADQSSACGFAFAEGHDYVVYGYATPNGLGASRCTRTHEVTDPADDPDIRWMEALPKAPPGASVFGFIRSSKPNGEGGFETTPLSGIAVSIAGPQSKTVSTDADGKFRADGLAPGKYAVSAKAPQHYAPFPSATVTLRDHACAELPWGTRFDGHIRGHVYLSDGTPAAGVYLAVKLVGSDPREPWTWQGGNATAASDGAFDFAELTPGSYVLVVNMQFAPLKDNGDVYYRKAFFPGVIHKAEAAGIPVGPGESVDNLRFFLPPDSAKPSVPIQVTVLDFDGKPAPKAEVIAYDDIWENSVTPLMATADENGKASLTLRPGSHYDIEGVVNSPDFSQACAEPAAVDVRDHSDPVVLIVSHHVGNCLTFKKPREESR